MAGHTLIELHPETRPFRAAAAQGRFLVPCCKHCDRYHWYPRAFCPFCFCSDIEWREHSGDGTIYAFSVNTNASPTVVVAYVTLDVGPTMLTNIVDAAPATLQIGRRVKATCRTADGNLPLVAFTLS